MTSVNTLDVILLILALIRGFAGWRRGVFAGILSLIGVVAGGWAGLWAGPQLVELLPAGWDSRLMRTLVLIAVFLIAVSLGSRIGHLIAVWLRGGGRPGLLDSLFGAAVSIVVWLLAAWFLLASVLPFSPPLLKSEINSSQVYQVTKSLVPAQWATLPTRTIDRLLRDWKLPDALNLDQGLPEHPKTGPKMPTAEPDPDIVNDPEIVAARDSILQIASHAPACTSDMTGSGWVVAPGRVVTNAHVVAGSQSVQVYDAAGTQYAAQIIALDPDLDIAILAADGLNAPALQRNPNHLATAADAVSAGFPWGGPYALGATRIRGVLTIDNEDIYGDAGIAREAYAVRGELRPGNSGGPLLDLDGHVVGTVFAQSLTDPQTGYALTDAATASYLDVAGSLSEPVSSGACAAE